jgi:hypothetical protein
VYLTQLVHDAKLPESGIPVAGFARKTHTAATRARSTLLPRLLTTWSALAEAKEGSRGSDDPMRAPALEAEETTRASR